MNKPLISVIIAARNSEATLRKCLNSVFLIRYPHFEVIVVDDGSHDGTGTIAKSFLNVKVLTTSGVGPSGARNLAVAEAHGAFIAFTDADCLVSPDWLDELTKGFVNDRVAGAGGCQKSPEDEDPFGLKVGAFLSTFGFVTNYMQRSEFMREVTHNASCNVIYRKSAYQELGGLREGFWPGEDLELDYRLRKQGYALMMTPQAVVYHYRVKTLAGFKNMMFRYGWAQAVLVRSYGIFRLVQWIPFIALSLVTLACWGILTYPLQTFFSGGILSGILWGWLGFEGLLFRLFWVALFSWHAGFLKGLMGR